MRGRRGRDHMAEFGESILYMPLRGDVSDKRKAKANLEARFQDGVFLGLGDRSDEIIVHGAEGIRKARTIRRRCEGERWRKDELLGITGTPLQPNPGETDARIRTRMEPGLAVENTMGQPVTQQDVARELGQQRPFYMMRHDVRTIASRIGYTQDCKGC